MIETTEQGIEQFIPTDADMTEFYDAPDSDYCRECGTPIFDADSFTCFACDIEQWIVEMQNFHK